MLARRVAVTQARVAAPLRDLTRLSPRSNRAQCDAYDCSAGTLAVPTGAETASNPGTWIPVIWIFVYRWV